MEVTTGLTGSGVTEILSGLSAGEQLVTVGQAYLSDGAPVRIVTEENTQISAAPVETPDEASSETPGRDRFPG